MQPNQPRRVRKGARLKAGRAVASSPIQARRLELNLTQDEVGQMVGVTGRHIANIEAGRVAQPPEWLFLLADALEVDPMVLFQWFKAAQRSRAGGRP
jgi:transcriptional regulator with XRE-family HTH domain